jgi:hypothetical protein
LCRFRLTLGVFAAVVQILAESIHSVFHFADTVGNLRLCNWSRLGVRRRRKAGSGEDRRRAKYRPRNEVHIGPPSEKSVFVQSVEMTLIAAQSTYTRGLTMQDDSSGTPLSPRENTSIVRGTSPGQKS